MDQLSTLLFVSGTDTGVGKTIVTCGIAASLRNIGVDVGVMKPVETGFSPGSRAGDAFRLCRFAGANDPIRDVAPYRYREPVAPWIAAKETRRPIRTARIIDKARLLSARHEILLIEGVGGLLVPLNRHETVLDLVAQLDASLLLVTSDRVGTINHTLLSVRAARAAGVRLIGVLINASGNRIPPLARRTMPAALRSLSGTRICGKVPRLRAEILDQPARFGEAFGRIIPPHRWIRWLTRSPESPGSAERR